MRERLNIYSLLEYSLIGMFIYGGISVLFADAVILPGIFALLVGQFAIYFYSALFAGTGLALLYAKIKHTKQLHKNSLSW